MSNGYIKMQLAKYESKIESKLNEYVEEKISQRIWEKDYTVWKDKPDEVANRLGWLFSPNVMKNAVDEINSFVDEVGNEGMKNVLVLGMGGSSLAPEVYAKIFGEKEGYLNVDILDSTHPGTVREYENKFDPAETLYIVSTKSGGTVETISFMKYFYNYVKSKVGDDNVYKHFAAITDPGSGLEDMAKKLKFRKIFLNDPDIGGRYSALSFFGLVPAALCGIDLIELLNRAETAADESKTGRSIAATLGIIMGELSSAGIDKVTFVLPESISYFGAWVEQLIAESTGKLGKGILPVEGEELLNPDHYYRRDRLFVLMQTKGDKSFSEKAQKFKDAGFPVIEILLNDKYDLAREYINWEFATAVAGWCMQINPFDQPNVESAKVQARNMLNEYKEKGSLPDGIPSYIDDNFEIYGDTKGNSTKDILKHFVETNFKSNTPVGYISIQAYIKPSSETDEILQNIRTVLQKSYRSAVTIGYGPRFLHSTGQLHKGDAGNGIFIQITDKIVDDVLIPNEPGSEHSDVSFGTLITAQALGDRNALLSNNRNVLRIHIKGNLLNNLKKLF